MGGGRLWDEMANLLEAYSTSGQAPVSLDDTCNGCLHSPAFGGFVMFFTRLGMVAAWLTLVLGAMRLTPGLVVAWSETPPPQFVALLGSETSGQAIDKGILMIMIALALGTIVEISRSVRRRD